MNPVVKNDTTPRVKAYPLGLFATTEKLPPPYDDKIYKTISPKKPVDVKIVGIENYDPEKNLLYFLRTKDESHYEQLFKEMNGFYKALHKKKNSRISTVDIKTGNCAAGYVRQTGNYSRVRLDETITPTSSSVWCSLIDYSQESYYIAVDDLFGLRTLHAELTQRVLPFRLKHLEFYTNWSVLPSALFKLDLPSKNLELSFNGKDKHTKDMMHLGWLRDKENSLITINEILLKEIFQMQPSCIPLENLNSWFHQVDVIGVSENADVYLQNPHSFIYKHLIKILEKFGDLCYSLEYDFNIAQELIPGKMYLTVDSNRDMQRVKVNFPISSSAPHHVAVTCVDTVAETLGEVHLDKLYEMSEFLAVFPPQCAKAKLFGIESIQPNILEKIIPSYKDYTFSVFLADRRKENNEEVNTNFVIVAYEKLLMNSVNALPELKCIELPSRYMELREDFGEYLNSVIQETTIQYSKGVGETFDYFGFLKSQYRSAVKPTHITHINWSNPKYSRGKELVVVLEKVKSLNSILIIEKQDMLKRGEISEALQTLWDNHVVADLRLNMCHVDLTKGNSLYMLKMDGRGIVRAIIVECTHLNNVKNHIVTIYLIDYGTYFDVPLFWLRAVVHANILRNPVLSIKAKFNKGNSKLLSEMKECEGKEVRIRICSIETKTSHYVTSTRATIELIDR